MLHITPRFNPRDAPVVFNQSILMAAINVRYAPVQVGLYLGQLPFYVLDFALYPSQDMHDQEPNDRQQIR